MADSTTLPTLQQIAATARAGRLDAAALLVEQAQRGGLSDPMLAALGGAIEFHRGHFARALPLLGEAHRNHPADLTVRANLAEALYRTGEATAALALCDDASVAADRSLRLAGIGAHLAQERGDFVRAVSLYRQLVAARPDDWSAWNNLGNSLSAVFDWNGAAEALERAVELEPNSAPIQLNLGNALIDAGRMEDAERVLKDAAARFAYDHNPLLALATMYRMMGREDETFNSLRQAVKRAPDSAEVQSDYGQEAARRNEYAIAEQAFETALALDPDLGPSFVGLASVYERTNREDRLDPLHERALVNGVDAQSLAYIEALRFKRAGDIEAAFAALDLSGEVIVKGRKHHLRGTMLDRLGRYDEAFAEFEAMNAHWRDDPTQPVERAKFYRDAVAEAAALLTPEWVKSWTPPIEPTPYASPIIVLGFPRSGTTLLDTMLMADPNVKVLEEEPFMGLAEIDLGGPEAIATAGAEQLRAARDSYFARVAELVGPLDGVRIVDKHPLHLNKAALIKRLFPDAKFVLAMRHPCDVLLSCFITNFRVNNAMANFLRLEDAATLYDQSFAHWEKARDVLDLPVASVVYERLIEDKARELQPVFAWLGLAWPGDEHDHRDAARARGVVATASYSQVTEPLYTRAVGRWHRYIDQLEPVFVTLRPWVERFGYSLTDGRFAPWPEDRPQ